MNSSIPQTIVKIANRYGVVASSNPRAGLIVLHPGNLRVLAVAKAPTMASWVSAIRKAAKVMKAYAR
jgi:hypothetical protein